MKRWLVAGATLGALCGLLGFAPAAWLAGWVAGASGERLLLADARGTVWDGSAVLVLTGGPGSRDASTLPGRMDWRIRPDGLALRMGARHACCLNGTLQLRLTPGVGTMRIELLPAAAGGALGQWPAAWLSGLGTPWNTLQPGGALQLSSPGLTLESAQGRWRLSGRAELALDAFSSRLSTLDVLGSYRLSLAGAGGSAEAATLMLRTAHGPLLLSGSGELGAGGLRFRGSAGAEPGQEAVLNNLLNIIGRRQGAQALIAIG